MTYDWRSSGRVRIELGARLYSLIARLFRQGCTALPQLFILTTNVVVVLTLLQVKHDSIVGTCLSTSECKLTDVRVISYTLTFMLLASEMVTFCLLVAPLPHAIRKRFFRFLHESPIVAKVAYGLKITFMFVHHLYSTRPRYLTTLPSRRPLTTTQIRSSPLCRRTSTNVARYCGSRVGEDVWSSSS